MTVNTRIHIVVDAVYITGCSSSKSNGAFSFFSRCYALYRPRKTSGDEGFVETLNRDRINARVRHDSKERRQHISLQLPYDYYYYCYCSGVSILYTFVCLFQFNPLQFILLRHCGLSFNRLIPSIGCNFRELN